MIVAAGDKGEAVKQAKNTAFYKHTGFKGADSHIDKKYGVDVDDFFEIADISPQQSFLFTYMPTMRYKVVPVYNAF